MQNYVYEAIESCFPWDVKFHYPKSTEQFEDLFEVFKVHLRKAAKIRNNNGGTSSWYSNDFFIRAMVLEKKKPRPTYCYG